MGDKFIALVGSGQQTCRPSHDEKGLKDWAPDGRQVCRLAANFSVTKMQEENSIIQSPCFFQLANKLVAHLVPN
jgi:hypothetical protein